MNEKKKIIYVGIRQSDSKYSPYIDDNCCVFVDDYQKNILRENQNKLDVNTIRNIERKLTKFIYKYEGNVSSIFNNKIKAFWRSIMSKMRHFVIIYKFLIPRCP